MELLTVDYFSQYPEVQQLKNTISSVVIAIQLSQCLLAMAFLKLSAVTMDPSFHHKSFPNLQMHMSSIISQVVLDFSRVIEKRKEWSNYKTNADSFK